MCLLAKRVTCTRSGASDITAILTQASARGGGQGTRAVAQVRMGRDECATQCQCRCVDVRTAALTAAKVFELVIGEIEKSAAPGSNEPQPSKCVVM